MGLLQFCELLHENWAVETPKVHSVCRLTCERPLHSVIKDLKICPHVSEAGDRRSHRRFLIQVGAPLEACGRRHWNEGRKRTDEVNFSQQWLWSIKMTTKLCFWWMNQWWAPTTPAATLMAPLYIHIDTWRLPTRACWNGHNSRPALVCLHASDFASLLTFYFTDEMLTAVNVNIRAVAIDYVGNQIIYGISNGFTDW